MRIIQWRYDRMAETHREWLIGLVSFLLLSGAATAQEIIGSTINNGGEQQLAGGGEIYSSIGEPLAGDSTALSPDETTWTGFWQLGSSEASGVREEVVIGGAEQTTIAAAFPTPFSTNLYLEVTLARPGKVVLALFDPLGREVERLADGHREAGTLYLNWRPESLEAGTYFVRLSVDGRQVSWRQIQYYR